MVEFVPIALACGHALAGWATFEIDDGEPPRLECPEGCGLQTFVAEPAELADGDGRR